MFKILLKKLIFSSSFLALCFLINTDTAMGQCGSLEGVDLQSVENGDGTCDYTLSFYVTNPSGSGNASVQYFITTQDGQVFGIPPQDWTSGPNGNCQYRGIEEYASYINNLGPGEPDEQSTVFNFTSTCGLAIDNGIDLLWTGYSSINCGGNACADQDNPLPVELTNFDAKAKDKKIDLSWSTASEQNNLGFDIQRSNDGRSWETLGFVAGRGTTSETIYYSYEDDQPLRGYNYYRLKQLDFDGQFEYSEVVTVLMESNKGELLKVFPNPSNGLFKVGLSNPHGEKAFIKLFDSTGSLIWTKQFSNSETELYWEKEFDLPQREVYLLMTQVGTHTETQKVIIIDEK